MWYIQKTIENGWSRNVLIHQIDTDLYSRHGGALTNFQAVLPAPQSDLYRTTAALPEEFKAQLPSIEDLQKEIEAVAAVVEEFDREEDPN